jgi:hypothetical protein
LIHNVSISWNLSMGCRENGKANLLGLARLGALGAIAVSLPGLGALVDCVGAVAGWLFVQLLRGAAAASPVLSGDPDAHFAEIVVSFAEIE